MSKKGQAILIWILMVIGLMAIAFGMYGAVAQPARTTTGTMHELAFPVTASDNTKGNADAKAVLVEYSDFQCPACGYFYGAVKQLEREKGDAVRVVYRNFPLSQHRYARVAAFAAEAAGKQGKFWQMHDMLFEKQNEWGGSENIEQALVGYAALIGLDIPRFLHDMQAKEIADKIDGDIAEGTKQNLQGTPTFYLNGRLIQFRSYEELRRLIETELNK